MRRAGRGCGADPVLAGLALLGLVAGLLLCPAGTVRAGDCADYDGQSRWVGTLWLGSPYVLLDGGKGLAARNDTLVVVNGTGALYVVDAGSPAQMRKIGSVSNWRLSSGVDVALQGDFAFVTAGDSLRIYSLTDPTQPRQVSALKSPDRATAVTVSGNLLLQACDHGLWIVDVTDPLAPASRSYTSSGADNIQDVARSGDIAWLAWESSLVAMSIVDPASPVEVGRLDGLDWIGALVVRDGIAYLAGQALTTVDVSDPAHPARLGGVSVWGSDIALDGDFACVTSYRSTATVDVRDPAHPILLRSDVSGDFTNKGVVARDGHMFVARYFASGDEGLEIRATRLEPVVAPAPVGAWTWDGPDQDQDAWAVVTDGGYAYCLVYTLPMEGGDGTGTLVVLDIADPRAPHAVGRLDLVHIGAAGIAKHGDHVLVAGADFQVVDVGRPETPALVATLPMFTNLWLPAALISGWKLQVSGDRVLAVVQKPDSPADWNWAFVDISDITTPRLVGALPPPLAQGVVQIEGERAYTIAGDSLRVFDIADPVHPIQIGGARIDHPYCRGPMLVRNGLAYTQAYFPAHENRLDIFDVSDSTHPALIGSAAMPELSAAVELHAGRLYLGGWDWGQTSVVDVSVPSAPRYLGPVTSGIYATALAVTDNCLVIGPSHGLITMPLACETLVPIFLASFTARPAADGVTINWSIAAADPGQFRLTARTDAAAGDDAGDVTGADSWPVDFTTGRDVFTACDASPRLAAGGVITYTLEHRAADADAWQVIARQSVELDGPPRPVALLAPHPNPFNPLVRVPFVLARSQRIRLAVYDLAGRRVATLADGLCPAGAQEAVWRGTDTRGAQVASGSYVVRIEGEQGQDARSVTLLK